MRPQRFDAVKIQNSKKCLQVAPFKSHTCLTKKIPAQVCPGATKNITQTFIIFLDQTDLLRVKRFQLVLMVLQLREIRKEFRVNAAKNETETALQAQSERAPNWD